MTKEFEQIRQAVESKKIELDTITRVNYQNEENKRREEERIKEQKRIALEQKIAKSKKILEDSGVIKLFEEIRDTGLVKWSEEPINQQSDNGKETKPYQPAIIKFGFEDMYKHAFISLQYNNRYIYDNDDNEGNPCGHFTNEVLTLDVLSNGKIGEIEHKSDGKRRKYTDPDNYIVIEKEIKNIPNYIVGKLKEGISRS